MTADHSQDERHVVPRWRTWAATVSQGEVASSLHFEKPNLTSGLSEQVERFKSAPDRVGALEVISAALAIGDRSTSGVVAAAKLVLDNEVAPSSAREAASRILEGFQHRGEDGPAESVLTEDVVRARVRDLRRLLRTQPRNGVRWADLGFYHATLGNVDAAGRALRTAVELTGSNRFVLRSTARFHVANGDPDKAHDLLSSSPEALEDPWLLSAEIASAQSSGRRSKHLRRAQRMLDSAGVAPWHTAELAASLATEEMKSGKNKVARRLLRRALLRPTENALAQVEWVNTNGGLSLRDEMPSGVSGMFEAAAIRAADQGDFPAALENAGKWLADQPFDPEPAAFATWIAEMGLEDFAVALAMANVGLRAHPFDATLLNNAAVAHAHLQDLESAKAKAAQSMQLASDDRGLAVARATQGLIAFRSGHTAAGREGYSDALERLRSAGALDLLTLASLTWAREEVRAKTPEAGYIANAALVSTEAQKDGPLVGLQRKRLEDALSQYHERRPH